MHLKITPGWREMAKLQSEELTMHETNTPHLMKKPLLTGIMALAVFVCRGQAIPPLAIPGQGALVKAELIYPLDNRPTPQVHASTIVETPSGLVSAFFAGTKERHPDVGIRVSRLVKGQWTWPKEVANGVINDTLRYPCWNPVLFLPKAGPLMLFYKVGPSPQEWWGMVMTSPDGGITWSKARKLGQDKKIGHLTGPVKNKPVQLADGTLISPSSTESKGEKDSAWRVHFEISRDGGKTWTVVGPINDGADLDGIQPSILFHANGSLQAIGRTRQEVIFQTWSADQGKTWSKLTSLGLPNPNSGTDAVTLRDGRQLLVYNHTTREGDQPRGRNRLNLALSKDGRTWKPVMTLENVPNEHGYSYPALIESSDGKVHITYTYNRYSVKYVVVDPMKLDE
jgi:predicted neuraminidase